jgi:nucleotide-binding universal stress UspA family protein
MHRFKNILYVSDPAGNKPALERAARLARFNGAKLTIATIHANEEMPVSTDGLDKMLMQIKEEQVQEVLGKLDTEGLNVSTKQLLGIPFIQVVREVKENGIDLVIKPVDGPGKFVDMLFGSFDMHLMRKCPCPVWMIKSSQRKQYARILAAVDTDPKEKENVNLNALILDLATSLALKEGSELHIVHAWKMHYEAMLRSGRAHFPKADVDNMVRDTRKIHKQQFDTLLEQYDLQDLNAKIHLLKGEAGEVVPELAHRKRVELVIMGTVARTGIPGFFIGNTAEKTLSRVDCSVLTVKPGSFSTPV